MNCVIGISVVAIVKIRPSIATMDKLNIGFGVAENVKISFICYSRRQIQTWHIICSYRQINHLFIRWGTSISINIQHVEDNCFRFLFLVIRPIPFSGKKTSSHRLKNREKGVAEREVEMGKKVEDCPLPERGRGET